MTSKQLDAKYSQLTGLRFKVSELIEAADDADKKKATYDHLVWHVKNGLIRGVDGIKELVNEVLPALAAALEQPSTAEPSEDDPETYTAEEAAAYNAKLDGAKTTNDWKVEPVEAQEAQPAIYSFESYDSEEKTTKYGEGKVKVIEMRAGGATVEVTENTSTDPNAANFVGQQFNVATGLATDAPIQLYTLENNPVDIWVVVTLESEAKKAVEAVEGVKYTQEEADAYNSQLDGAVKAGDSKTNA